MSKEVFDLYAEKLEKGKPQLHHPSRQTILEWPRRFASDAMYTRTLANCDAEELARVIAQVLLKAQARETNANGLASG
ncbi:hypothetical protein KSC_057390 [Ktedonobacter sp. SOSP1-52]|uniref:hypothetical protein n=1 Tax=Ktedonobacter sp. SOSP1-52 TaxID=2778366 RepID=UPI001914EBD9|nr:hypothetical protein [Ktedonobacter sp. SOSP1-52]GHO66847.1 hypothetical protein KSC_057390 [Ktedonobacter sp. SOSP1-52]